MSGVRSEDAGCRECLFGTLQERDNGLAELEEDRRHEEKDDEEKDAESEDT